MEQGLSAVRDVVTGVTDTIGDFLGNVGNKLIEVVSSLASWATNAIRDLGQAFANGAKRIVAWVTDKLRSLSPLGYYETKREVVQRDVLDIVGSAVAAFFKKLVTVGLVVVIAAFALGVAAVLGGPVSFIVAGVLALLVIGALIFQAIDVIERMRKGGFPVWFIFLQLQHRLRLRAHRHLPDNVGYPRRGYPFG